MSENGTGTGAATECEIARERMTDALGEGSSGNPEPLDRHLASCGPCRDHLERMRRTWRLAAGASARLEPSPESWVRLKGEMTGLQGEWERRRRFLKRLAMALAFALPVLFAVAWILMRPRG